MSNEASDTTIILGLGREGLSTARYLLSKHNNLSLLLLDEKPLSELEPEWQKLVEKDTISFAQTVPTETESPLVYCAPGIPPHNPLYKALEAKNAVFTSNLELFCTTISQEYAKVITIGVTGTKGKSTTSALLYHVLQTAGFSVSYAGNVGIPALDILPEISTEETHYVVLELSSHQLGRINTSPNIAVVQNIVPEHLDYYGTFENYLAAKMNIAKHQTDHDRIIYSLDFETSAQVAALSPGKKYGYSLENPNTNEVSQRVLQQIKASNTKLIGQHNRYNIAPSIIIGEVLGIDADLIHTALESFQPLSHRLEMVPSDDGVLYINDSLATTPEATIAAIDAFIDKQIILISGGYDRSLDFFDLAKKIVTTRTIKAIILFPPTGENIANFMYKINPDSAVLKTSYFKVESMSEAVHIAKKMARKDDVVLMSPAAASFGRFRDYADRGNQFKRYVQGN